MNKAEVILDSAEFASEFSRLFAENGLSEFATDENAEKFFVLTKHMLAKNAVMNLTAITEPAEIILKHYADSLKAAKYINAGASVIDVGCGAGFPSLPLAIARPDIMMTAIDSTEKRIAYVNDCKKLLSLSNLTAITSRAEDAAHGELRESFDYATARAVARLNVLAEYCIPFLKVGGRFLPMKAKSGIEELDEAKNAISLLHSEIIFSEEFLLYNTKNSGEEPCRFISGIEKKQKTEKIYPRNNSQIKKKPL